MTDNREPVVPEARQALNNLKYQLLAEQGYYVNPVHPEEVKYEVAEDLGVPLKDGYNGNLTTKEAGKVGGAIGGNMVREMIKMAEKAIVKKD